jgi:penicillin-binding protein-related factor A (putative recombinase)
MKNEAAFSRQLKKLANRIPYLSFLKLSDKYKVGLSDYLVIFKGQASFIECKFKESLKGTIKYSFTPAQKAFFITQSQAGARCFGLIWVEEVRRMFLLPGDVVLKTQAKEYADLLETYGDSYQLSSEGLLKLLERVYYGQ